MSDFDRYTRVNKFEKRRKNTKLMSLLIVAGSFLIILLIGLWIFGPDDKQEQPNNLASSNDDPGENEEEGTETGQDSTETEESSSQVDENQNNDTDSSNESNDKIESELGEKEQVDPTGDDDNVIEAYTQNWQPVGTDQEGPHTTQFVVDSQEWEEMEMAIRTATGLTEADMITWFIGNGGHQKAVGTVTNKAETEIYRVYLSWVDNQGWQPTLVEVLSENDKK